MTGNEPWPSLSNHLKITICFGIIRLCIYCPISYSNFKFRENSPSNDLWGIVNNAGLSSFGEIEWVPMATYRKIMEVNMFGLMRGIQVCLPLIRKAQGRIVTTTSGLAKQAVPTRSPYVFTKYALTGFMDVLRYEMEAFGVKVNMNYRTL